MRTFLALFLFVVAPLRATTISLLHVSDYHSHAQPFFSEGSMRGGIARTIGFLQRHKKSGVLVFNGGDTMNKGAPAWSDKYRCAEWEWLNGVVDAMAFGNHDADYGNEELNRCREGIRYPILSANTTGFERYRIFEVKGIRVGVFAIAGADFPRLVTNASLTFSDPVEAARDVTQTLRQREHADLIVMIGHEHAEDDYKLARLADIDIIFGTHTHMKREFTQIPNTHTWFISPFQYGSYVTVVDVTFDGKKRVSVRGRLAPIDESVRADPAVARRVAKMQRDLEADPAYRELFVPFAKLPRPMEVSDVVSLTLDTMRDVAHADAAMSTASSFRQALPKGPIDPETLRAALPYDNEIVVAEVSGAQLQQLYDLAVADPASDAYSFTTKLTIDPAKIYKVAITDYMARVAASYRDRFVAAKLNSTGMRVRAEVMKRLRSSYPNAP